MDMDKIKTEYQNLNRDLHQALSRMERSDKVFTIREAIKDLQRMCPHDNGSFDFSTTEECPYCGRKFTRKETDPDWKFGIKTY